MEPEKLEVLLLIFKTLDKDGPYKKVAESLREILEEKMKISRVDFKSQEHEGNLTSLLAKYPHLTSYTLENMLSYLKKHLDKHIPTKLNSNSYLGSGQFSLLRSEKSLYQDEVQHSINTLLSDKHCGPAYKWHSVNITKHLQARRLKGPVCIRKSVPPEIHTRTELYRKLMGHLSSVYCVCFDQTGQYIFTGADDHLIKIWSASDGRLLRTLRGHDGEITDMSVNFENRLLASGGMDKVIRIWDLKSSRLLDCLASHNATVTSVKFAPYNRHENHRYLVSTSNDGSVIFWQYDTDKFNFKKHRRYKERTRPGGQITCCSFSTGGSFLACGSSDNCVHVYGFDPSSGPYWIAELDYHKDPVDSIQFSNRGFRFISGSQDGTAAIWSYKKGKFEPLKLDMLTQLDQSIAPTDPKQAKPRVLIVQWSRDDRYVMTSIIDYSIKVWDSVTGRLVYVLKEHKHDVYLIESHPIDPRIFVSASHDGTMIIWDLDRAKVLKRFFNKVENPDTQEAISLAQIYDLKFSPDGNMIASTDSYGYLSLYGNGSPEKYKHVPEQLFFHTDYRALIRDMRHFVMDEQTHVAPHLMPKPMLVDMNGNPYPRELQRFVPDYKSGERFVVAPLSENQIRCISENIRSHSMEEDEEFLEQRDAAYPMDEEDSDATIEDDGEDDDATQIDSDNTVVDDLTEIDTEPETNEASNQDWSSRTRSRSNHRSNHNNINHNNANNSNHHSSYTNSTTAATTTTTTTTTTSNHTSTANNSSSSSTNNSNYYYNNNGINVRLRPSSTRRLNGNSTGNDRPVRRRYSARIRDRKRFRRM